MSLRIGVVLSREGGAPGDAAAFRLGMGGPLGSGRQFLSLDSRWRMCAGDRTRACIVSHRGARSISVAPIRDHRRVCRTLGRVLNRPAFVRVPVSLLRLLVGEMADEAVLAIARVLPKRLLDTGYVFESPELRSTLERQLGRTPR